MENSRSIVFFTSVILSLVFAWFFIWPSLQGIDAAKMAIELERENVELLQDVRADVQAAVSFYAALSTEERELIELAAPSYEDQINAVVVLDRLARENGLLVNDISTNSSDATSDDVLGTIPVALELQGSYSSVKAFLVRAENSLRIFDMRSIEISANSEDSENPDLLTAQISGNVYFTNIDAN